MSEDVFKKMEQLAKRDIVDARWLLRGRREVTAYMAVHPKVRMSRTSVFSRYLFRAVPAFGLVALLLIITGGVSWASQGSIPGDFLYPWKIGVVESLESAFVVGAQSQAQFEVTKTTRRLQEVTDLAIRKETDTKVTSEAQTRLEVQVKVATDKIAIAASEDKGKALETALELNATLQAHKDVLNQLQPKTSTDIQSNIQGTIDAIEKNSTGVVQTIKDLKEQTKQDVAIDPSAKLDTAKKKLDAVWTQVSTLDESSLVRIEAERKLSFAQDALSTADDDLTAKDYAGVISDIETAMQFMSDTNALLEASANASDDVKIILVSPSPTPTITVTPITSTTASASSASQGNLLNQ